MSHLVPVREYASAAEMLAAYKLRLRPQQAVVAFEKVHPELTKPVDEPEPLIPITVNKRRDWIELAPAAVWQRATTTQVSVAVSQATGISIADIRGERRTSEIVAARQLACWLMRKHTTLSLPQIGRAIGNRDHTTVLHAVGRIDRRREADELFAALVDDLSKKIETGGAG